MLSCHADTRSILNGNLLAQCLRRSLLILLTQSCIWSAAFTQVPIADSFDGDSIQFPWILVEPNPSSSSEMTGSALRMIASHANGGSDLSANNYNASRLIQAVDPSLDWVVETAFDFMPTVDYQGAGILLSKSDGLYSTGTEFKRISERAFYPNGGGNVIRSVGNYTPYSGGTSYLRLQKSGNTYTGWWSSDGVDWQMSGITTLEDTYNYVGLFAIRQPWKGGAVDSVVDFHYIKVDSLVLDVDVDAGFPNHAILSWLESYNQYELQATTSLDSDSGWIPVDQSEATTENGTVSLKHEITGERLFFRLFHKYLDLDDGLSLYLKFDGNTLDSSPNATDATNSGATLTADQAGNADFAYYFDGSGTQIQVADTASLDVTKVTLAFWFRADSLQTANELVNKMGTNGNMAYGSELGADGTLYFRIATVGGSLSTLTDLPADTTIQTGTWYHFVGTYDGARMRLYLNGELDGEVENTGDIHDSSDSLRIGRYGYYSGWDWHGTIDEVIIWNRALSAADVRTLYLNGGKP